jgi:hypothetical protein
MRGQFRFQHAGRSEIAAATAGATFGATQQSASADAICRLEGDPEPGAGHAGAQQTASLLAVT